MTRKDTTSAACVHGDPNATRSVVVYGNSRAAMWIPALDLIGTQQHWRIIQLTKPGCQAPEFPRYSTTLKREYTECSKFHEWALSKIAEIQPDLVIISSAAKDAPIAVDGEPVLNGVEAVWESSLTTLIKALRPHAGRIILLGDASYPGAPGIDCLTAHENDVRVCGTSRIDAINQTIDDIERRVAAAQDVRYVETIPWLCTESFCPAVIAGLTTFRDGLHVSENYVVWLSTALGHETGLLPEEVAVSLT